MSEPEPLKCPDLPVMLLVGLIALLAVRSLQRSASPVSARESDRRKANPSAETARLKVSSPDDEAIKLHDHNWNATGKLQYLQ